jgi:hypothetical protein
MLRNKLKSFILLAFSANSGLLDPHIASMRYWNFLRMSAGLRRFLAVNLAVIADVQIDVAE